MTAMAEAANPVVQYGSTGPFVKTLERDLRKLGLYHGAIDGIFGPHVRGAVKVFEESHGLDPNGIVSAAVWQAMYKILAPSVHISPPFQQGPGNLREGSVGPGVTRVQRLLIELGARLAPDGQFGPETEAAVVAFQRAHGIAPSGIVGSATLSALTVAVRQSTTGTLLRYGDTGRAVTILQRELTDAGYSTKGIDGIFGPATEAAVKAFQRREGLPVTGVAGKGVETALMRALETNRGLTVPGSIAAAIVGYVQQFVGDPYQWGGESPTTGFDCSGLMQYVFRHFGIALPRTSYEQFDVGTRVSLAQLEPGDLLFFSTDGPGASHVGLYLGGGSFIAADDPAVGVRIHHLTQYWLSVLVGATIPPGL